MTRRPKGRPTVYVGPVSVYIRYDEATGDPSSACAWIGTECIAEYDGETVAVAHPDDIDRDIRHRERDGVLAVDWMDSEIRTWLGDGL